MAKKRICGIYKIENKINSKIYVGQSINIYNRWQTHISDFKYQKHANYHFQGAWNKYGKENFEFTIIEECSQESLNEREIYWINIYNSSCPKFGYNLTTGGQSGKEYTDSYIEKMREVQKSIPIIQLNLDGEVIKIWEHGAREAAKKLGYNQSNIWKCINGLQTIYKNCIWMDYDEYLVDGVDLHLYENNSIYRRIVQLSYDGRDIIRIWNSPIEIKNELNIDNSCIVKACKGKIVTVNGFRWMYYTDYKDGKINFRKPNKQRVAQLDKEENIIGEYESFTDAEEKTGINKDNIRRVCNGKGSTAGGYKWQRI